MKKILITGANGFVGRALCLALVNQGYAVRAAVRAAYANTVNHPNVETVVIGEIDQASWQGILEDVEVVIHLAARVHQINDLALNPQQEYQRINVDGSINLAKAAAAAQVKRLVFLSTIKVNGERSEVGGFTEQDLPHPEDDYAKSKWQAELKLKEIAQLSSLELVILRIPLVYGPGVKANFAALLKLVRPYMLFPFGLVNNKRSFIYIENLVDALIKLSFAENASGKTYLVADDEVLSTKELILTIAEAKGIKIFMISIPPKFLVLLAKFLGRQAAADRLLGSLCLNNSQIKQDLGWQPPYTLQQALRRMMQ